MPKTPLLWAALPLLAACVTTTPRSEPVPSPTSNPCAFLPLPNVSQAARDALAAEMETAPAGAAWPDQVTAYLDLRAAVRACRAGAQ